MKIQITFALMCDDAVCLLRNEPLRKSDLRVAQADRKLARHCHGDGEAAGLPEKPSLFFDLTRSSNAFINTSTPLIQQLGLNH